MNQGTLLGADSHNNDKQLLNFPKRVVECDEPYSLTNKGTLKQFVFLNEIKCQQHNIYNGPLVGINDQIKEIESYYLKNKCSH